MTDTWVMFVPTTTNVPSIVTVAEAELWIIAFKMNANLNYRYAHRGSNNIFALGD